MGFNTSIVLMNDCLHEISKEGKFGEALAHAIQMYGPNYKEDCYISPGVRLIETHHADDTVLVAVGGNSGTVLGSYPSYSHNDKSTQIALLEAAAGKLGYTLTKRKKS